MESGWCFAIYIFVFSSGFVLSSLGLGRCLSPTVRLGLPQKFAHSKARIALSSISACFPAAILSFRALASPFSGGLTWQSSFGFAVFREGKAVQRMLVVTCVAFIEMPRLYLTPVGFQCYVRDSGQTAVEKPGQRSLNQLLRGY